MRLQRRHIHHLEVLGQSAPLQAVEVECSDIECLSSRLQWTEVALVRASDPVPHHDGVAFGNEIQDRQSSDPGPPRISPRSSSSNSHALWACPGCYERSFR